MGPPRRLYERVFEEGRPFLRSSLDLEWGLFVASAMRPTSAIFFDDSLWPLLVVRFVGSPSMALLEEYLSRLEQYLQRGERFVSIMDATLSTSMGPSEQRRLLADWIARHEARLRELWLGTAFLINSPVIRLALGIIFHLKPLPVPYLVTSHLPTAAGFTATLLEEVGLPLPGQRIRTRYGQHPV